MKIEAGKFYKIRDGRKVRIYCTDASGERPDVLSRLRGHLVGSGRQRASNSMIESEITNLEKVARSLCKSQE